MPATPRRAVTEVSVESLSASGRSSEKLSLLTLQSKMKCDPEGYETELALLYSQFKSSLELFQQQAALNFTSISGIGSDPTVAKDLGDRAMFLSHVTPFYPKQLSQFPKELADFLRSAAATLPSFLRSHIAQALILLVNRKIVDIADTLALFMELQTLGDRVLKKLAFEHVVHSIRRMNQKHKNDAKNRALQNILFSMVQQEDENKAKRALVILCDLHKRKVWFDERTANIICTSCFHPSPRIMTAALLFLLDYENIEVDDDSDASSSEDDSATPNTQVVINREALYKANNKGTTSSKKKKKAKLQRAIRSMKKQQRNSSENSNSNYYSPLNHLKDAQGFAEKLFSRVQTCNERFEIKMMMLKVITRTVGLHRLVLLNLYPYLQKYVQPHQSDITTLLAAAVQACHDMVPPDAVEPLFRQIVNQFVHDKSRTEAIAVGLNVVREICLRMPLLMNEDLLHDLVLYKKSNEKAVSCAARSLIALFREVCPSLLTKKDRGRPTDPNIKPKAFGEVDVASDVDGVDLLQEVDSDDDNADGDNSSDDEFGSSDGDEDMGEDQEEGDDEVEDVDSDNDGVDIEMGSQDELEDEEYGSGSEIESDKSEEEDDEEDHEEVGDDKVKGKNSKAQKRKFADLDVALNSAETSLRALKRLAGAKNQTPSSDGGDGILSNEDFKRIRELKTKKDARNALAKHGLFRKGSDAKSKDFKVPSADQLSSRRVDPATLEAHIKRKMSKEERLELVRAGREDGAKYQAKAAVKQKKTGGSSNRQKESRKKMPLAAKRSKIAKSRIEKKKKAKVADKNFRGKKAWK